MINRKARILASDYGSANGNRTRILALKGLRANRCTIAPHFVAVATLLEYGKWRALTSTTAAPRQWSPFRQGARPRLGHVLSPDRQLLAPSTSSGKYFSC